MVTTVLMVPDISCEHCARTVTNTLTSEDGVQQVDVDVANKQVRVEYDDSRIGLDRMRDVLADEEYPVASVEDTQG